MNPKKYKAIPVGAGATVKFDSTYVGGFLCTTAGSITINRNNDDGTTTALITGLAVVATGGLNYTEIPMLVGYNGGSIVSTGAIGVLLA
jgi:hypothetical protein